MTGTLVQNNHHETYYVVDTIISNYFGNFSTFKANIINIIEYGEKYNASKYEIKLKNKAYRKLIKKLDYIRLRRELDQIQHDLPLKIEKIVFCDMTPKQWSIYKNDIY